MSRIVNVFNIYKFGKDKVFFFFLAKLNDLAETNSFLRSINTYAQNAFKSRAFRRSFTTLIVAQIESDLLLSHTKIYLYRILNRP